MSKNSSEEEETFTPPFPSVEALRPFIGKWVGYDDVGEIRVSGKSMSEAGENARATGLFERLCFFWVPDAAVIG
ncbi:MAG: hypothetical protein HY901_02300 [Deltaproteobacteria bacterium]|nr:hypothetical protein [Deltaproteobacteria bacterium]